MSSSAHNATPRLAGFDHTMALLREGYDFVSRRCDALGSDQFQTLLMLRPVVCLRGSDAAEMFYDGDRFTRRRGAMPPTVLRLLQDKGSVQQLDGAEHRHRKAMFVGLLMDPEAQAGFTECFKAEWHSALDDWAQRSSIVLFDEVNLILTRAVFRWTGVPLDPPAAPQMAVSLSMMIERAGKIGPSLVEALWRRRVVGRYVADVIAAVRGGTMNVDPTSPLAIIANHRDANGQLLDIPSATVEVINLLRPTVAVGRFIMFAAMALEDHPEWKTALKGAGDVEYERFAEKVRRLYPFFPFIGGTARVDFYWEGTASPRETGSCSTFTAPTTIRASFLAPTISGRTAASHGVTRAMPLFLRAPATRAWDIDAPVKASPSAPYARRRVCWSRRCPMRCRRRIFQCL